jgi:hypothetical protein
MSVRLPACVVSLDARPGRYLEGLKELDRIDWDAAALVLVKPLHGRA